MADPIRLLVVDNDPDVLESMAFLFRDAGYLVVTAASQREAMGFVARETFAFVLADMFDHSPECLRQLEALREAAYPTPVGLTSAWYVRPEDATCAGFTCFIAKPFDLDDILRVVATALRPRVSHASVSRSPNRASQSYTWYAGDAEQGCVAHVCCIYERRGAVPSRAFRPAS